jgi:hypothetical protein
MDVAVTDGSSGQARDDECDDDYGESQTSTIRSNALPFVILGLDPRIHAVTNVPPMTVQA